MPEIKSQTIGDNEYQVVQLTATKALQLTARLSNALGPALAAAVTGDGGTTSKAASFFGALLASPQLGDHLEWLCKHLAPSTQVTTPDGKSFTLSAKFDTHFAGDMSGLIEWLVFACEVNAGSFFAELLGGKFKLPGLTTSKASKSPTAAETTG